MLTLLVDGEKMFYKFCEANVVEATDIQIKNWRLK